MSQNPYEPVPEPASGGVVGPLFAIGGLLVLGAIVVFLFLPATRRVGTGGTQAQCLNNLKNVSTALYSYAQDHDGQLPPAYTIDDDGQPLHSWRTLILPYLDQQALFDRIDLTKPWNHPDNKFANDTVIRVYQCPENDSYSSHPTNTTYLGLVGADRCFLATEPRRLADIRILTGKR